MLSLKSSRPDPVPLHVDSNRTLTTIVNNVKAYLVLTLLALTLILFGSCLPACESAGMRWMPLINDSVMSSSIATATIRPNDKRLRILHYIDNETYTSLMDRWYIRSHISFTKRPELVAEAVLWGAGFPGYNDSATLLENIQQKYKTPTYFDAILPYYNVDQVNVLKLNQSVLFEDLRELSGHNVTIIDRPHEMRDDRRAAMIGMSNASLVVCPYGYECDDYAPYFGKQALIVHQPHPVDAGLFHESVTANRPNDLLLAGNLEPLNYPLRYRLSKMIGQGLLPGEHRKHPDYPDIFPKERKEAEGVNEASMERQLRDYSRSMAQSKICVVTSSKFGYAVQKYGEAAASGCLIVGNIPAERQDDFAEFVVPLSMNQTDDDIRSTIQWWLDHDKERKARAKIGQDYFLRHFNQDKYAEQMVDWIRLVKEGRRGTIYPYTWTRPTYPLALEG